jgi:hypothetical protein
MKAQYSGSQWQQGLAFPLSMCLVGAGIWWGLGLHDATCAVIGSAIVTAVLFAIISAVRRRFGWED